MGEARKAIYTAVTHGDVEAARRLFVEQPAKLRRRGAFYATWLHDAARKDDPAMIRLLVELGLEVDARDDHGMTPLMIAAQEGALENVRVLMELGADIHASNQWRATAVVLAAIWDHLPVVQELVAHGARVDVLFGETRWKTIIEKALEFGHQHVAAYLRELGAPETAPASAGKPETELDRLVTHVETHIGPVKKNIARNVDEVLDIHLAVPREECQFVILVSSSDPTDLGIVMTPPESGNQDIRFAQFAIQLPKSWPLDKKSLRKPEHFWPLERMGIISWLPSLDRVWLGETPLIVSNDEPPQPLGPGTSLSCTMLIKDWTLPPLRMEYGKVVHFYTLVPLYTEERDFEKQHGFEALLKLFDEAGLDFTIDPQRRNLAAKK